MPYAVAPTRGRGDSWVQRFGGGGSRMCLKKTCEGLMIKTTAKSRCTHRKGPVLSSTKYESIAVWLALKGAQEHPNTLTSLWPLTM